MKKRNVDPLLLISEQYLFRRDEKKKSSTEKKDEPKGRDRDEEAGIKK